MPALFRPKMKREYDRPCSCAAALMRTIHSERNWRFFWRRSRNAYCPALMTACLATLKVRERLP
jgi:hypothetical protein